MPAASADRNLLFGILALQMDFVTRDQLVAGMNAWVLDKAKSLGEILKEQDALSADRVAMLAALMAEHLKQHGDNPAQSLAAVSSLGSAKSDLAQIADADVQASLGVVASSLAEEAEDPYATRPQPTVGVPTSAGLRFRILRPHAEGGLGKVSVAEDGELHREVALKEIKDRYADHTDSRARFILEAEVTGGLEHPGIVPVYGLGTYADGRPFYAMRFIKGDSLKEAIERFHSGSDGQARRLSRSDFESSEFRGLLGRFVDVCQAIGYAHSRKVLHRDLKPGNIMLGKYGETLVVDWGLAKPLYHGGTDAPTLAPTADRPIQPASASGTEETIPGMAVGTPEYMSPEQAQGRWDIIGPASDIYSLGATLFAVLTGRSAVAGADVGEMLRRVQRGEIASARQLCPGAPPALEAVCRKAQVLNPADRYGSALDLAADVEHWLADEPVTAWREPVSVRAWRWVRRHRTLTTTAAALVLATAAGLGLLATEKERARVAVANEQAETAKERDAKEAERIRALASRRRTREALDAMLSGVTGDSLTTQQTISPQQKDFLLSAIKYYEEFAAEPGEDREGRERLAKARFRLGMIRVRLGQLEEGRRLFRSAADQFRVLANDFPPERDYSRSLAASYGNLGNCLSQLGRRSEADDVFRAALVVATKLVENPPNTFDDWAELARRRRVLIPTLTSQGRSADALAEYRKVLSIQEKLVSERPSVPEFLRDLAASQFDMANLLFQLDKQVDAESVFRTALEGRRKMVVEFSGGPDDRRNLGLSHNSLGVVFAATGRLSDAMTAHNTALVIQGRLVGEFPQVPEYRNDMGRTHNYLAILFGAMGKRSDAEAAYRAAIALLQKLANDFPAQPEFRSELASSYDNLAILFHDKRQWHAAEKEYREALAVREKLTVEFPAVPGYRSDLAQCYNNLGLLLAEAGERVDGESALHSALAIRERLVVEVPSITTYGADLGASYCNMARLFETGGDAKSAIEWYAKAIQTLVPISRAQPHDRKARQFLLLTRRYRSRVLIQLGRFAEASAELDEALKLDDGASRDQIRLVRAECAARLGRAAEAVSVAGEVAALRGADPKRLCACATVVSIASAAQSNPVADAHAARAVDLLRQAIAKGYADIPHLLADADLAPLRRRADYADLLWDLADVPAQRKP